MIEWVVFGVAIVHSLIFLFLYTEFRKVKTREVSSNRFTFSILIPVRNEEENIGNLLGDIEHLDYSFEDFEVIVIDDNSEDRTVEMVNSFKSTYQLRLVPLLEKKGKKPALELGVSLAKNDIILTTDGDCRITSSWLKSFNSAFTENTQLVVGPVKMEAQGFFGALQSFDFTILIGYAASLVGMGKPSMSNGANMAYRRRVFTEVKGYNGNDGIPSGDDEFLLLKVATRYPKGIKFLKSSDAVVSTSPKQYFGDFLNQRKRWLSKWTLHKKLGIVLSVLLTLIDNLVMIGGWIGMITGLISYWFLLFLLIRSLAKTIFTMPVNSLLGQKSNILFNFIYEVIYPFYVVLLSFASIFGNYTWKGRKYR